MCVTDILRDMHLIDGNEWVVDSRGNGIKPVNEYTNTELKQLLNDNPLYSVSLWYKNEVDREKEIQKYNDNPQRFLFYAWGIFVTSFARAKLLSGVLACGNDYIYSDTDSLKILNYEKHAEYFKKYNEYISERLKIACEYHGFDPSRVRPLTIKGVEKPLGVWDDETAKIINHGETPNGYYPIYKTLGAKRYMYLANDELHVTVAGSNPTKTAEYLTQKYGKYYAFYKFDNNLRVPVGYSGRTTSCYIDYETEGEIIDYRGERGKFHELTSVHVEQTEYTLSIADAYIKYFLGIQNEE